MMPDWDAAIAVCSEPERARAWCDRVRHRAPHFACVAGFTATAAIDGISAAGLTPRDRLFTANADLDFLLSGNTHDPLYPLPPLVAGASPVLISRAIATALHWPCHIVNAGLPYALEHPVIDLRSSPARCVSSGRSLERSVVEQLFQHGLDLGQKWSAIAPWLIVGECVVGGTTTALGVLAAMGIEAEPWISSSLVQGDRHLKASVVRSGLDAAIARGRRLPMTPIDAIASLGDPMQPVVAGIALGSSVPVLLAGGTQMLAVWELARQLAQQLAEQENRPWGHVVVGTTRWVVDDLSADATALATALGAPLLASRLNLSRSRHASLRAYEQGYVKEGVGAGGAAIGAVLHQRWSNSRLVAAIDAQGDILARSTPPGSS